MSVVIEEYARIAYYIARDTVLMKNIALILMNVVLLLKIFFKSYVSTF